MRAGAKLLLDAGWQPAVHGYGRDGTAAVRQRVQQAGKCEEAGARGRGIGASGGKAAARAGGTQRCTDIGRDERNCGRCGNICGKQDRCINDVCTSDCPPGHTFCRWPDGTHGCTNTQTDRFNCGGCGQGCPSVRPTCRDGRCN